MSTSQGMPGVAGHPQKLSQTQTDPCLEPWERSQPCRHLGFSLLTSRYAPE